MSPEQFKKEQAALHEPSATEGRFMFPEQFKKEQAAPHEPAWERGVYAASASPAQGKLKRRERRAPVKGLAARQQNPVLISGGTNVPAGGSSYFGDPR